MIEIKYEEHEIALNLYETIKNVILSKKGNPSFNYTKEQHHLYEETEHPGISKDYYNESGMVEYINIQGETIILQISRWHPHKHNGYSGLNSWPCLTASIYQKNGEEKKAVWELKVKIGTMTYKAEATSLEIPQNLFKEKTEENTTSENVVNDKLLKPNLLEARKSIEEDYDRVLEEKENLLRERKLAIEKAIKNVRDSYAKRLEECDKRLEKSQAKRNDYNDLILKYSTFDENLIGNAIQELIRIIEGLSYEFQVAPHKIKVLRHGIWGGQGYEEELLRKVKVVINVEKKKAEYQKPWDNESEVLDLVNRGDAILLSEGFGNDKKISFYTIDKGNLACSVNYGRFDYIKDFIDYVIEYRFQNEIEQFTIDDALTCIQEFIKQNRARIMENYITRINDNISMLIRQKN